MLSLNALLFRLAFVGCGPLVGVLLAHLALATVLWFLGAAFATLALVALAAFARAHVG